MDQPSAKPSNKVTAATLGGALTVLAAWGAGLAGLDVPPEAASAFTTLVAGLLGYIVRDA